MAMGVHCHPQQQPQCVANKPLNQSPVTQVAPNYLHARLFADHYMCMARGNCYHCTMCLNDDLHMADLTQIITPLFEVIINASLAPRPLGFSCFP